MDKNLRFLALCLLISITNISLAYKVNVNGYYKKNGTYVAPYVRNSPNSFKSNNWFEQNNINSKFSDVSNNTIDVIKVYKWVDKKGVTHFSDHPNQ